MSKINETLYRCDWCSNEQEDIARPMQARTPTNWHGQIVCKKCGRYINQK